MPRDVFVNINFPDCPPDAVKGIAVACQGKRDQELLRIEPRFDGRGNPYYWIAYDASGPPKHATAPIFRRSPTIVSRSRRCAST